MPQRKGLLAPQNTFLDTIATRFDGTHSNFVLGNAQAKDHPIVYCSDGFCELTGFTRAQVMCRSCACRFLWGEETTLVEKKRIESALIDQTELKTEVAFYKKSGSIFNCLLDIVPIKNENGQVVLFLASHKEVCKEKRKVGFQIADDELNLQDGTDDEDEVSDCADDAEDEAATFEENHSTTYKYERRRSRAVLYHLSGQFEPKKKTKMSQFNKIHNFGGKSSMPEYKMQEIKKSRFILLHYGLFKIFWDWCILLCTFYIAFVVPYNAAFLVANESMVNRKDLWFCDLIIEVLFVIDIVLNYRTTFVSKSGQVVYSPRMIALNYLRGWFLLDLLAAIPFDFVIMFQSINDQENVNSTIGPQIHLMKLARLLRLARLLQKIDRYSQYSTVVLGLLMSMFTLCAHWLACIWYAIGQDELKKVSTNNTTVINKNGWLYELSEKINMEYRVINETIKGGPSRDERYLAALYFTCSSLTSVGFGNVSANTNNEKIFSICAMLIGALMHAAVFGNVTAIIQRMYAKRHAFQTKTRDLKDFTRIHRIPKNLKQRMHEFFQTMWSVNRGINPDDLMKDFPEELRGDIMLHLNREVLSLPIFETACQGCLKSLAQQIKTTFCTPGEYLVHCGDVLKYIYFVCSGSMEILKDEMVVAILGKGDLFGTDISHNDDVERSTCDVKSLTYCDIQCIELNGLLKVLQQYPEYHYKFNEDLLHDLTYNMRDGADEEFECDVVKDKLPSALPSICEEESEEESDENCANDKHDVSDNNDDDDDADGSDDDDGSDGDYKKHNNVDNEDENDVGECDMLLQNWKNNLTVKCDLPRKGFANLKNELPNKRYHSANFEMDPREAKSSFPDAEYTSPTALTRQSSTFSHQEFDQTTTLGQIESIGRANSARRTLTCSRHSSLDTEQSASSAAFNFDLVCNSVHNLKQSSSVNQQLDSHSSSMTCDTSQIQETRREVIQVRDRVMQMETHLRDLQSSLNNLSSQLMTVLNQGAFVLRPSLCDECDDGAKVNSSPLCGLLSSNCSDKTEVTTMVSSTTRPSPIPATI